MMIVVHTTLEHAADDCHQNGLRLIGKEKIDPPRNCTGNPNEIVCVTHTHTHTHTHTDTLPVLHGLPA